MGFVKVVKNHAYFKRYQVKFRRRRECKTDYYARQRLILQDKNKYKSPKYRLVARFTNKDIVTQVVAADLDHDVVIASAYAHELKRYGLNLGLTNYAAAYCTGLLLARRVNKKFNLDYDGVTEIDGEDYNVVDEEDEERRPFKALLDVGLHRTVTGARLFGVLKGACDGGLNVPHNTRRFPGSSRDDDGNWDENAETHRHYIFGGHVADYMKHLQENDEEKYKKHFSRFIAAGIGADDLEGLYSKVHAAIRADPNKKRGDSELGRFKTRKGSKGKVEKKRWRPKKRSIQQRKNRIKQKLLARGLESCKE